MPTKSVVVEDNRNGLLAAKAAGFNCLITTSEYTVNENFPEADMLVEELGDDQNIKVSINDLIILCSGK